jgi:error-prone DNA polymerase
MYVELHARSAFSFLEGASTPEELAGRSADLGMSLLALTDRDGVYGAPRFYQAARKLGIRAGVGAEVASAQGFRYPLLVESRTGYQNLCRLITRMKLRTPKGEGAITESDLDDYASGLVCLTGGDEGPLTASLARGGIETGKQCVEQLCRIFGRRNVYVELQRHLNPQEEARNKAATEIARSLRLPLLATNGVCYAAKPQREIMDVFTCLRNHRTLETAGQLLARNSERYLKCPEQMARLFADQPEAIANTQELSSRLEFTLSDLGYEFPRYPVPAGKTQMQFLRERTEEVGLARYDRNNTRAWKQINHELAIIQKLDLSGYFLIVWDIVQFCREQNILVQGRGSAANSAVCYALGITAVDPISMDLLFERFLSEERGEWPDIDLDLPSGDQRERAIQYVYERYGKLGAAMTANVITYRARSAAREVGKTLGFDTQTLNQLSSLVSAWEYSDAKDTFDRHFQQAGLDLRNHRIRKFLELCVRIQNLPRHLGQHSGGMVVCQGQLDSVVPLEPATMNGRVVVQWDKEDCSDLKLIKIDLLGLGMMAVLEDSIKLIRGHYGREVDLAQLPPDDPQVYEALQRADTIAMFQIESRAQMSCLPRLRPKKFYDLVVEVAIIRPGPIVGNMVHPYLKRHQGREEVTYPHPSLEPVLKRTLGVPLFQEQLLKMAMIAADFSGGEAEELRRAFGFKRSEARMKDVEKKLRQGMERKGISNKGQEEIIKAITSFALYGFPESHAASFALLAYASAYLKCYYLAAFTAAMLNNQPLGFYSPATVVKDAQRHGLRIKPIDVTRSEWFCTLETHEDKLCLRMGLRYVKGLREEAAQALVQARKWKPFISIDDLVRRVPLLRKLELVMLAEVGALNWTGEGSKQKTEGTTQQPSGLPTAFCPPLSADSSSPARYHRRDALWQVERAAKPTGPLLEGSGFVESDQLPECSPALTSGCSSPLAPMSSEERLVADFRGTGLTVGPHPMAYCRAAMNALGVRRAIELANLSHNKPVKIAGGVIARQRPGTAKGFVFLSLEDETGVANAIVTPDLFEQYRFILVTEQFLMIEGKLQHQDNVISVKAEAVYPVQITNAHTSSHDFH